MSEALKESILLEIPTDYGELLDHFHTEMWNRMGWVFERGLVLVDLRVGLLLSLRTPQSKSTVYDFRWQWSSCKEFYTPPDILLKDGHLLEWKGAPHGVVHSYSGSPEKALWYAGNFRERGGSHITRGARPHYVWVEGTNVLKRRWQTFAADLLGENRGKLMSTHPTIPTTYAFLDTSRGASQVQIVCQERTLATFGTHTWSWTRLGGVLSAYNMADHALMAVHPCHTWHEIEAWSVSRRVRHPIQDLWGRIWAVELTAGPMRLLCSSPSGLPELALTVM